MEKLTNIDITGKQRHSEMSLEEFKNCVSSAMIRSKKGFPFAMTQNEISSMRIILRLEKHYKRYGLKK